MFRLTYLESKIIYLCPMDHEIEEATIERLSEKRRFMMVDLGGFGGATSEKHPPIKDGMMLRGLCPFFDVVKASIEDLEYILGIGPSGTTRTHRRCFSVGSRHSGSHPGSGRSIRVNGRKKYAISRLFGRSTRSFGPNWSRGLLCRGFLSEFLVTQDPFEATLHGNVVSSFVIERTGGASTLGCPPTGKRMGGQRR